MADPSSGSALVVQVDDGIADLMFNRPSSRNPMDYATIRALTDALRSSDADSRVRCVLLRGAGKGFCSGGDLGEFRTETDRSSYDLYESGGALAELLGLIPQLSVPVVVAAHGFAMAGGCGLVAVADVALAAAGTRFGSSEVKIGLFPLMVLPALCAAVGSRRAREIALTGRTLDAEEALRIGLVHRVLPAEGFTAAARRVAMELASLGGATLALGKSHLRQIEGMAGPAAVEHGRAMRSAFMTSPDFDEGVSAFLEKRAPNFS